MSSALTVVEVLQALLEGKKLREKLWSEGATVELTPDGFVYKSVLYPEGKTASLTLGNGREYEIV